MGFESFQTRSCGCSQVSRNSLPAFGTPFAGSSRDLANFHVAVEFRTALKDFFTLVRNSLGGMKLEGQAETGPENDGCPFACVVGSQL
jgi:hypothetical protein